MYYKVIYNYPDDSNEAITKSNGVFAKENNIKEISSKLGFDYRHVDISPNLKEPWPDISFYYYSKDANELEDYLLNV